MSKDTLKMNRLTIIEAIGSSIVHPWPKIDPPIPTIVPIDERASDL